MRVQDLALTALPLAANAINVVLSNDDGWAVSNIRQFFNSLNDAGFATILSAPADNQSGTSSLDSPPDEVDDGCQFRSCPPGSPPTGNNASDTRLNYVNSYPVTSIKYGISTLSPEVFGGPPDIAVAGPNVGSNIGIVTEFSGTVGAATEAAKQGIPAIAFSGASGDPVAWNAPVPAYSTVYADLSTTVTQALTSGGEPYLPDNTWLNVNFPDVSDSCASPADFSFVLSRIYPGVPILVPNDVETCDNGGRLPSERSVVGTDGCYVSISVGNPDNKADVGAEKQAVVLERLGSILSCLP